MKEGKAYIGNEIGLKVGEIIVADIIGEGFYRIHSFGECFVNVECLKLFGKGFIHRGHITNCHNTPHPIDLKKWLSYRRVSLKSQNKQGQTQEPVGGMPLIHNEDANVYIDRAIKMLKEEYEDNPFTAGYNGIVSLLGYAKESHLRSISAPIKTEGEDEKHWREKFKEDWYRDNTGILPKKQIDEMWKVAERHANMAFKYIKRHVESTSNHHIEDWGKISESMLKQNEQDVWNAACKKILSDISETFLNPDNLKKSDSQMDRDVFKGIGETIKNFPIPLFKAGFAASLPSSSVTGESEAIAVLDWLLDVNSDSNGLNGDRLIMCDGDFYFESDNDGDQPMDGKDIYNLYKKSNPDSEAIGERKFTLKECPHCQISPVMCKCCGETL